MRLVMTLLVRDEADIVRENLDFHFAQGIDFAIVMDNGSTDGTAEILEEYAARGLIRLIHRPGAFDPEPWVNELVGIAIREEGADWVLPNDADEFWLPRAGTLKELLATLPDEIGAVVAQRHNFLPAPEGPEPWWERMTRRARVSLNAHGRPLPPKIVHRAHPGLRIRRGNHRRMPPREGRVLRTDAVEVLHFQMRSYAQFERRVIQIGSALVGRDDLPGAGGPGAQAAVRAVEGGPAARGVRGGGAGVRCGRGHSPARRAARAALDAGTDSGQRPRPGRDPARRRGPLTSNLRATRGSRCAASRPRPVC
jgi:hypothetical protein